MPGKVNPTQCEAVTMVAARCGLCDGPFGGAQATSSSLQARHGHGLVVVDALASGLLGRLHGHVGVGIAANEGRIGDLMASSLMLVTALNP